MSWVWPCTFGDLVPLSTWYHNGFSSPLWPMKITTSVGALVNFFSVNDFVKLSDQFNRDSAFVVRGNRIPQSSKESQSHEHLNIFYGEYLINKKK